MAQKTPDSMKDNDYHPMDSCSHGTKSTKPEKNIIINNNSLWEEANCCT